MTRKIFTGFIVKRLLFRNAGIILFLLISSFTDVFAQQGDLNKLLIIGQLTSELNGAPLKNHEVHIIADSVYYPENNYNKIVQTDFEGYFYDTIMTKDIKGAFIIYTYDEFEEYHDTTVYFRFYWSDENVVFANFILPVEPPAVIYQANFYYQRNPSGQNNSEFQFYDITNSDHIISWQWNFGDGNFSSEPNPLHDYANTGIYKIKLTVNIQPDTNGVIYETSIVKVINVSMKDYFHIGGHVFAGYFPIDIGEAYLYKVNSNNTMNLIDTAIFNDSLGYYLFYQVIQGDYIVKADLDTASVMFNQYFSTYYSNKPTWKEADTIFLTASNFEYDINLIPANTQMVSGPGNISGTIYYAFDNKPENGAAASNVEILLMDEDNEPVLCCHSNENGGFEFNQLPMGSYTVYAEVTGKETFPLTVCLDENSCLMNNIVLTISNYAVNYTINAVSENKWTEMVSNPYPNPVDDYVNIDLNLTHAGTVGLYFYSATGKLIKEINLMGIAGTNHMHINISGLKQGVYFLSVSEDNRNSVVKKFIKQ